MRGIRELKRKADLKLVQPSEPPMQLDVSGVLDRIESTLESGSSEPECRAARSLLRSWQWNDMITDACQERARSLSRRYPVPH